MILDAIFGSVLTSIFWVGFAPPIFVGLEAFMEGISGGISGCISGQVSWQVSGYVSGHVKGHFTECVCRVVLEGTLAFCFSGHDRRLARA